MKWRVACIDSASECFVSVNVIQKPLNLEEIRSQSPGHPAMKYSSGTLCRVCLSHSCIVFGWPCCI